MALNLKPCTRMLSRFKVNSKSWSWKKVLQHCIVPGFGL
jgi:hypothetical protein